MFFVQLRIAGDGDSQLLTQWQPSRLGLPWATIKQDK
jgi:hypothetical protein